jgi:sugar lactone lactonase YvrE
VRVVARGLSSPNGIVLSPDGKTLYVSESRAYRIHAFSVTDSGALKDKRTLVELNDEANSSRAGFDGMTVDRNGNIFVATKRLGKVYVVSPSGDVLRRYRSGLPIVANLAFAPDSELLYVVGSSDSARTRGGLSVLNIPGSNDKKKFNKNIRYKQKTEVQYWF